MPTQISNPRTYADLHRPPRDPPFVHALYDNSLNPSFNASTSSSAMLGYLAHGHHHQLAPFPSNPYPSPPPPPIHHKVWILDCKSCGNFVTNRGMKAVLLLRPNVSLYSSDALPVNCSAYTSDPDALRPRASCRPSPSHVPPRTCECLTQTLCCHGCGATIGYMIVIPCARCTSSITATNRATNGHRFVFHSSEVVATERHYIADEPGVIPFEPISILECQDISTPLPAYSPIHASRPDLHMTYRTQDYAFRSRSSSPASLSDYLPTPPLEFADPSFASTHPDSFPFPRDYSPPESHSSFYSQHFVPPRSRPSPVSVAPQFIYHLTGRPTSAASPPPIASAAPPLVYSYFSSDCPAEHKEPPSPRKLQPGDILFWHHLVKSGEIPGVQDDARARSKHPSPSAAAGNGRIAATLSFSR
ncbi:putative FAM72 protein [Lyophyllum shimeji]|uniref:FAM72 protein n=1 Tax=Lyophyllum shimeji TaxID=47721 RepID=A0A9P3UK09_LYOSH|nr:putative FAM72 protein [Lyophyllum shimeji]